MALNVEYIEQEIIDQYLYDENKTRPWIIGFSGGKDSTMLLQLVWKALLKIKNPKRHVYVVCNNTLVENPRVEGFVLKTLAKLEKALKSTDLPITVHETLPRLEDSFWVNMIGRGYPAPTRTFRWCTERLKINPTTNFILNQITDKGEAIILLGTRTAESASRARSIKKNKTGQKRLRKHPLTNAYVYAPITDVITDEVWQYLMQVKAPWGNDHKELFHIYRNANGGDCPLVLDTETPSCGNSRFGCWVCTVVDKDKSMAGFVDNGDEWMLPLMELRDYILEERNKSENRMSRSRTGVLRINEDGENRGPYTPKHRHEILEKLLQAQRDLRKTIKSYELISQQEMVAIQMQWYRDGKFDYKVSNTYNKIFGRKITMDKKSKIFEKEEALLKKACSNNKDDFKLIQDLLAIQKNKTLLVRKRGLVSELDARLSEAVRPSKSA